VVAFGDYPPPPYSKVPRRKYGSVMPKTIEDAAAEARVAADVSNVAATTSSSETNVGPTVIITSSHTSV